MHFLFLVCSYFVLLEAVNAQCNFPNLTNTLPLAGLGGGSGIQQVSVGCVASGPLLDTYRKAVIFIVTTGGDGDGDVNLFLVEAVCDSVTLTYTDESSMPLEVPAVFQNFSTPCADCSLVEGESVCSPCPESCSALNFELGSERCFNTTCCPYYDPQTLACTTECISKNVSSEFTCYALPPAIVITIDGDEFRNYDAIGQNYYIFDPSQGSSNNLSIQCNFEGDSTDIQALQNNSFWKVAFNDPQIDSQVQNSSLEANLTDTLLTVSNVMVEFVANNFNTDITFDPMFEAGLTGLFQCHSSVGFNVQSPVSVTITSDNPMFEYSGDSVVNLVFPATTFNVTGLIAEYRHDGMQIIAESELSVYYDDGGSRVDGVITLIDAIERTYKIVFSDPLPAVVSVTLELDLLQQLDTTKIYTLTINSHGLQIQPSSEIKVPVGSTISVVCVSLVPGISIEWSVDASNGSALVIPNVNNSLENTEYCCDVIDELSIFPEEAESFLCLTLLVFPSPVSIRISDSTLFLPQPTFYNAPFESPFFFTVTCNGLEGHRQLQWTTDYDGFNSDLLTLSPVNGSVVSSGLDEVTLSLTSQGYSDAAGNFTCTSGESGLSASIFLPGISRYISLLDYPTSPVSIGEEATITYLAANRADGYVHFGSTFFAIFFLGMEAETPSDLIQVSSVNPFTFFWTFTVSSLFNTTIETSLGGASVFVTIVVRGPPSLDIVSAVPPYRYVARQSVNLQCRTSDSNTVVSWFEIPGEFSDADADLLSPPDFNISQSLEGISAVTFIPYIFDIFNMFTYPPEEDMLMLTDIVPVDNNWINVPNEIILGCTVCDMTSLFSPLNCITMIDLQTITVEPLFHNVTWTTSGNQFYNGSIRNRELDDFSLICKSTRGSGDLELRTDNAIIDQFFTSIDFTQQQISVYNVSNLPIISVNVTSAYDIGLRIIGQFATAISGDYTCYSRESNEQTTILLTTDVFYVEFLVPSIVSYTLGTSVVIPYRSGTLTRGTPSESSNNFVSPEGEPFEFNNYEVSPYNYVLYIPTLLSDDQGNYTVSIDNDGTRISPRTILLEIDLPTISVPDGNFTIREGENVTISCNPSDPRVQLTWSVDTFFFSDDVVYDSDLRHSLTVISADQDRTFYCHVRGDEQEQLVSPGVVYVNVLRRCPQTLQNGILSVTSFEGDVITLPCSDVSEKFTRSSLVRVTQECGESGYWLPSQYSTCTLVEGTKDVFAIIDVTFFNIDNVTVVQEKETEILTDIRILVGNTSQVPSLYVTRYIRFSPFVGIVLEAIFDPDYARTYSLSQFFSFGEVLGGLPVDNINFAGFQPSDICECRPLIIIEGGPPIFVEPSKREIEPQEELPTQSAFQSLCVGISVEPCLCSNGTCECQTPFVGDGLECTVDSDSDGYPDRAIDVDTCNETLADEQPIYCINDTCPNIYNPEQTPPICDTTVRGGCPAEIDNEYQIQWPSTLVNTTAVQSCGDGNVIGLATRFCGDNGEWQTVNATQCIARAFQEISITASVLFAVDPTVLNTTELDFASSSSEVLVEQLVTTTVVMDNEQRSLFPTELSISNNVLSGSILILLENFNRTGNATNINATAFGEVLSNLLDIRNDRGWEDLEEDDPTMGSELLLDNAEDFGLLLATSLGEGEKVVVSGDNILIMAQRIAIPPADANEPDEVQNIVFPDPELLPGFLEDQVISASIDILSSLLRERAIGESLPVVNIIFNNLQEFLQASNTNSTTSTGTFILSSQVGSQTGTAQLSTSLLTDPVNLNFQILPENFSDPSCVFWQFSDPVGDGFWSTSGVETVFDEDSNTIVCLSQHLTSFAVLVDTTGVTTTLTTAEALALSVVTYIGLSISIFCLVLTVIFFITFGKKLFTSVHHFVHLNLAVSLLLAYLVFVSGIETAADNKAACTVVAALLHYFFLAAFCWMLCEGLMLYLMLVVVFSTLSKKWWFFLLLGWLPPLLPVVITVGITHDYYTDGEEFCWLSVEKNVIWAFVVPMIIIILINVVFFILVMYSLIKNKGSKNAMKLQENSVVDIVKSTLKGSLILLPLLGLTWVFGLLAVVQQTTIFAWIFTILNAFQGAAIFFFHVVRNERVWNRITKRYKMFSVKSNDYSSSEHSSSTFEKKRKYFTPKASSSTPYSKSNQYELASIDETEKQEPDVEKDKPIETEYVQVGDIPDDDKKIDLSSIGITAKGTDGPLIGKEEEYQLKHSDQKDPNALLELVDNV